MSFRAVMEAWPRERVEALYAGITPARVEAALAQKERRIEDLAALLSPAARPYLEPMAREAQRLTRWHFGRTIGMYAPLYISNVCAADCVYCGFAVRSGSTERRVTLKPDEIRRECAALAARGFDNVLLLTGEAPKAVKPAYIAEAVSIAREFFSGVSVEIYALDEADYRLLCDHGLEGVTLYMETFDPQTYREVHLMGEKMDYNYRLDALERAGRAGARKLGLGVLLGLFNWRIDVLWLAMNARYLQKHCWQSALSVSFPRLRHTPERYHVHDLVTDADLVQIILAMRLFLPEAGFNLSTRETPAFRDRLIPLGITAMSAESSTRPGGYATRGEETLEQFEIEDLRPAPAVTDAIRAAGYDPVWKDFDHAFDGV